MAGTTVKDVNPHVFVKAYAAYLKKTGKLEVPKWVDLVKTATFKELAPYDQDWYYIRAASIARHIYLRQGVGIGALRKKHGSTCNRGTRPSHHCDASGNILRKIVQGLEKMELLEKDNNGGRRITQNGRKSLDLIASQIVREE